MAPSFSSTEKVDMLSGLPDEILTKLISCLPIEDAVATGSLSTRWRGLWKYAPVLSLDQGSMCPVDHIIYNSSSRENFRLSKVISITGRCVKFLNIVNEIQEQYLGNLETISIRAFLDKKYETSVSKWTRFIQSSGAKDVEIHLCYVPDVPSLLQPYVFQDFADVDVGTLEHARKLSLSFLRLVQPNPFVVFGSLVDLHLDFVDVSQGDLQNMVFACAMLRSIEVVRCDNLSYLRLTSPSLEEITVRDCISLKEIHLFCKKLTKFELFGFQTKLGFLDVPKIVSLTYSLTPCMISPDFVYRYLAGYCAMWTEFKVLRLSFDRKSKRAWTCPVPATSANYKASAILLAAASNYKVTQKFTPVIYLLASASSLREFELNIPATCNIHTEMENMLRNISPHTNLKRVRLNGFTGSDTQLELVLWIIENVIGLEVLEIKVSFCGQRYRCGENYTLLEAINDEVKSTTYEYLRSKVPAGCSLVIL